MYVILYSLSRVDGKHLPKFMSSANAHWQCMKQCALYVEVNYKGVEVSVVDLQVAFPFLCVLVGQTVRGKPVLKIPTKTQVGG